jgi:acetyl esterase/lipase
MARSRLSPLFGNFAGLPPLLFQVGSRGVLLDESTRAAARAHEAGNPVEVEIWENMGHVFQALPLPKARSALEHIARFAEAQASWPIYLQCRHQACRHQAHWYEVWRNEPRNHPTVAETG